MIRVLIRNLWGETDTRGVKLVDPGPTPAIAAVVGFGHVLCGLYDGEWRAMLAQGPGRAELSRTAVVRDGNVEVELLPNAAGEDRIVVIFEGLAAAATESPLGAQS